MGLAQGMRRVELVEASRRVAASLAQRSDRLMPTTTLGRVTLFVALIALPVSIARHLVEDGPVRDLILWGWGSMLGVTMALFESANGRTD